MKLLSIDVGIKNLAYCLFETVTQTETAMQTKTATMQTDNIILWGVINLCGSEPLCGVCKKKAKLVANNEYFCPTHALKSSYSLPSSSNFSLKKLKKMKLADLHQMIINYKIHINPLTTKKEDVLKTVIEFVDKQMLLPISKTSANEMDLVQIGIAMRKAFDKEFVNHLSTLDHIIIENQISPIANRMKSLQGMIAQYFIMHDKTQIKFVSAANKLKGYTQSAAGTAGEQSAAGGDKISYADRKKAGIRITTELLTHNTDWLTFFKTHKKKDDLADAFLQGKWYLISHCI